MIIPCRIQAFNHVGRQIMSSSKRKLFLDRISTSSFGSNILYNNMSTTAAATSSYVDLDLDINRGIGILTMKNLPVNSLSLEMLVFVLFIPQVYIVSYIYIYFF
jgi:hypothetical protein